MRAFWAARLSRWLRPASYISAKKRVTYTIVLFIISIGVIFYSLGIMFLYDHFFNSMKNHSYQVKDSFLRGLQLENSRYAYLGKRILSDEKVLRLFAQKNRKAVHDYLAETYTEMCEANPYMYIMHFHLPDNTTFLRMHIPQKFGDNLGQLRPMVATINRSKKPTTGFELGKNGIYFRVFSPAFYKEKYIGALEFGFKVDFITKNLSQLQNIHFAILIKNDYIKKKKRSYPYKKIKDFSLMTSSIPFFDAKISEMNFFKDFQLIKYQQKYFGVYGGQYLRDYMNEPMALMLLAMDVTETMASFQMVSLYLGILLVIILLGSITSLHFGFAYLIRRIQRSEAEQIKQHYRDTLIGLPNRNQLIKDLPEYSSPVMLLINIDRFRYINQIFGIAVGDFVLRQYAASLLKYLNYLRKAGHNIDPRKSLYRLSRDEFVILLQNVDISELEIARFITTFLKNQVHEYEGVEIEISVSIGIAKERENILQKADIALKEARQQQKEFFVYHPNMQNESKVKENLLWYNKTKRAIDEDRIVAFFQPIMDNTTGAIKKYECLLRLKENDFNIVLPGKFLPIARHTRLYPFLTKIMIDKALLFFKDKDLEFSINLSPEDIMNPDIVDYLFSRIHKDVCERATLEIIETDRIEDYEIVEQFIKRIKKMGCKIAIDDFGSGYSNFEQIFRLDIDFLKIDGSLIRNIVTDKTSYHLTKNIVQFAMEEKIATVAEYVSDESILRKVTDMGINYSQGYFIGRPQSYLINEAMKK